MIAAGSWPGPACIAASAQANALGAGCTTVAALSSGVSIGPGAPRAAHAGTRRASDLLVKPTPRPRRRPADPLAGQSLRPAPRVLVPLRRRPCYLASRGGLPRPTRGLPYTPYVAPLASGRLSMRGAMKVLLFLLAVLTGHL